MPHDDRTQKPQNTQSRRVFLRVLRALRSLSSLWSLWFSHRGPRAQTPSPPRQVFRSGTELVLVNVVVRDKSGAVVRNLSRDDFTVTEDDKPQTITSFDFEQLDEPLRAAEEAPASPQSVLTTPARSTTATPAPAVMAQSPKVDMRGRRLIVLFFDLSSMQPEELERAVKAAHDYVEQKLSPADLIAIASFSTSLQVAQDFTADRAQLAQAIDAFGANNAAGFGDGTTGDAEDTPDDGSAFTADDTEFNIFNTDRRLDALQTLAGQLAGIEQKKSVIYFSSGMSQQGQDNQVQLRRTVDRANRANVSIYAADMRGLQALVPGGDATQGSRRGTSTFSGASTRNQFRARRRRRIRSRRSPKTREGMRSSIPTPSVRYSIASSTTRRPTTCSAIRARTRRATAASAASRCV